MHTFKVDAVLQPLLLSEPALINRMALRTLEDKLAEAGAGVNFKWPPGHVGHFQDLSIIDAGTDKAGGDMNHETEAGKAASSFEPAADIARQVNTLAGNAVDRFTRL